MDTTSNHYLEEDYTPKLQTYPYHPALRSHLKRIDSLVQALDARVSEPEILKWIQAAITTHYRNFKVNSEKSSRYTPCATRAAAMRSDVQVKEFARAQPLVRINEHIAASILGSLRRRQDLISYTLEWKDGPGRDVSKKINVLLKSWPKEAHEQKEWLTEMKCILESPMPRAGAVALELVIAVMQVARIPIPSMLESTRVGGPAIRPRPGFSFLWKFRSPSANQAIQGKLEELVQAG